MIQDADGKGKIYASGNITSQETVSGKYLQPSSISVAGEACASNGLISKDSSGALLSCQSGVWKGFSKTNKLQPLYVGIVPNCNDKVVSTNPAHLDCNTEFIGYAVLPD